VYTSPHKRRKLQDDVGEPVDLPQVEQGDAEHEEAMPGFYEHDEGDAEMGMGAGAADDAEVEDQELHQTNAGDTAIPQRRPRPPVSAPARTSDRKDNAVASTSSGLSIAVKPRSANHFTRPSETPSLHIRSAEPHFEPLPPQRSEADDTKTGVLECPVCGKMLETDNQGLNSHIDFCLSRGTIMAAQTKAKSPTKGFNWWGKQNKKGVDGKRGKG
jgi:DNA polymerase kappa